MIDIRLDIDKNISVGDIENIKIKSDDMLSFLETSDAKNIFISDEKGIFRVLEFKMDLSSKTPKQAMDNYYMHGAKVYKKQLLVTLGAKYTETYQDRLDDKSLDPSITSTCLNAKDMMYMDGGINVRTNVKNVTDFIGKTISGSVTGEALIKPQYSGNGYIMLEPTYKYIILHDLRLEGSEREGGIIISDGSFLACSGDVTLSATSVNSISSATLGREGVFNLTLRGRGVVAYTSPVPKSDVTIVELNGNNDVLKVNGNYALAWSSELTFTVEPISTNIFGSAVSSQGFVNVYRGVGKVWLANVEP